MAYLWNACIIIVSFIIMEGVAWILHKYVMHGFLWYVHKDHHIPHGKKTERNDLFALVFVIPSWLLMMFGIMAGCDYRLYMGIGITLYGLCYVLVHDGLIHGRIKFIMNTTNPFLLGLRNGHLAHHKFDKKTDDKNAGNQCYGMLWVPLKYFFEARQKYKEPSIKER